MSKIKLNLKVLSSTYGVCRLEPQTPIPTWAQRGDFFTISKTQEELSILCQADLIPLAMKAEKDWRIFKIEGPFAFTQIGILNAVTSVLAEIGISLFAVSTFDTDYVMVKCADLRRAIVALRDAEHCVDDSSLVKDA